MFDSNLQSQNKQDSSQFCFRVFLICQRGAGDRRQLWQRCSMLDFLPLTFTSEDYDGKGLTTVGHQGRHTGICCSLISQWKARTRKGRKKQ